MRQVKVQVTQFKAGLKAYLFVLFLESVEVQYSKM